MSGKKKTSNLLFTIIAVLMLVFPLASFALARTPLEFPETLGIGNERSQLEGRSYAAFVAPSLDSVTDGTFQKKFEKFVTDHVPMRDGVLLFDAARQRAAISLSAALFDFPVYPTYFGSKYYAMPSAQAVLPAPSSIPAESEYVDMWLDVFNRAAEEHPDVNIAITYVLEPKQDSMNPVYHYLGGDGLVDKSWVQSALVDGLDDSIHANIASIDTIEYLQSDWFRTDHHWTLRAALAAYNVIAGELGLQQKTWDPEGEVLFTDAWQGTAARSGRDFDYPDQLVDQGDDFSCLRYYKLGKVEQGAEIRPGSRETFLEQRETGTIDMSSDGRTFDGDYIYTSAYSPYYGGQNMEIFNDGPNNGKTCLFIGDSFSRNLYRYIARNYEHTIYILPGNYEMNRNLESYFEEYHIDDVIVVVHAEKYKVVYDTSPGFFE